MQLLRTNEYEVTAICFGEYGDSLLNTFVILSAEVNLSTLPFVCIKDIHFDLGVKLFFFQIHVL